MLSILTPAFNEAANLPALHDRLIEVMSVVGVDWEWLIVDDHSRDGTFDVVSALARRDPRVRGIRLARNSGSHVAITCGLHHVAGDVAIMMAADLQDPPETISTMLEKWRRGVQVVWAVRRTLPGERSHAAFSALYYWVMRNVVGMKEMPARGADFFLIDRAVITAFRECEERNVSVFALITWLGFRQDVIEYEKHRRTVGRSGWTLARKIKLVVDSVVSFTDLPIRLASYAGLALIVVALVLLLGALSSAPRLGPLLLLAVIVGLGGIQLLALGLVGEYVWRAFEEARGRPIYLIEATAGAVEMMPAANSR